MLPVTGQRGKSRPPSGVFDAIPFAHTSDLSDPTSPINQKFMSGKREGSLVVGHDGATLGLYMATGEFPESDWIMINGDGGAGGGGDSRAIIAIDGSGENSKIRVTRASGRVDEVELAPTIQNTPAYSLVINNQGFNVSTNQKMEEGDGDILGGKITSKDDRVTIPVWAYDYGGGKLGGDYDTSTGDMYIAANSVEVTVQVAYNVGVHPSWPKYKDGKPLGDYTTRYHFEQKQPDGSWKVLGSKDVYHGTQTGNYPNTAHMSNSTSNSSFVVNAPTSGWYRITFSVVSYGNDESIIPYIRFGAYSGEFYNSNSTSKHFFQIKGSIKSSSGGEAIPPTPRP